MYCLNIYQNFPYGDFKFLETKYFQADSREEAKRIVFEYAKEKYKDRDVSVLNVN